MPAVVSSPTRYRRPKHVREKTVSVPRVKQAFHTIQDFVQMIDEELLYAELLPRLKHAKDSSRWLSLGEVARTLNGK